MSATTDRWLIVAVALTGALSLASALDPPLARYSVTSATGYRTSPMGGGEESLHRGVDLFGALGCDVLAAASGVVVEMWPAPDGWYRGHPTFGGLVVISHGEGILTLYGHMDRVYVQEGQRVNKGEPIGRQGNTGLSQGAHVHFELIMNPLLFFPAPLGLNGRLKMELLK